MLPGAKQLFAKESSALPYEEIRSVASDGTAYCALPYVNSSSTARMRMTYEMVNSVSLPTSEAGYIFGSHGPNFGGIFLCYGSAYIFSGFMFRKAFGSDVDSYLLNWRTEDVEHDLVMEHADNRWYGALDGHEASSYVDFGVSPVNNATRQLIFSANGAWRTGDVIVPAACANFIAITRLEYSDGTGYSCDLTPCREKATGEVCFWDSVNEEFIKNIAGSGSLLEVDF